MKLKPAIAYGLRIYQNGSSLMMHVDKIEDHVISAILHVDHEYDDPDEPWPLVIESFDGTTQEVNLQPGEMLFYESAKCMHGRPRTFKGKYYSSIFIHYLPVDWHLTAMDSQYMVPPHWLEGLEEAQRRQGRSPDPSVPLLEIVGTGFGEPECEDGWCNLKPKKKASALAMPSETRGGGKDSPAESASFPKQVPKANLQKLRGIRNLEERVKAQEKRAHKAHASKRKRKEASSIRGLSSLLAESRIWATSIFWARSGEKSSLIWFRVVPAAAGLLALMVYFLMRLCNARKRSALKYT